MSRNPLFRRIHGGLTTDQLATLPLDVLKARADYLAETDAELHELHEIEPPRRYEGEFREGRLSA